jgi:hypothetical protein
LSGDLCGPLTFGELERVEALSASVRALHG